MKTAVLGSTGYAGMTLLRLLAFHPDVTSIIPVSSSKAGIRLREADPGLSDATLEKLGGRDAAFASVEEAARSAPDVVLASLPHLKSARLLEPFYGLSIVVDLSADFRIPDAALFERAYGSALPMPERTGDAAYGLPEWFREAIRGADIIANPGCFPTGALLPLLPLAREGLVEGEVFVSALSGISGAGRKLKENLLFGERSENVHAYSPGRQHRHWAEIYHYLAREGLYSSPDDASLLFTPHLVPLKQGIATSIVARMTGKADVNRVRDTLQRAYRDTLFVRMCGTRVPETRDVRNSNRCDIGFRVEEPYVLLFSAIDNLHKGAAGQAIQNMNIRLGLAEDAGLRADGEF